MSLLDLKSDLSKFRSRNPKPDNSGTTNTPKANSYGDNFSAYQPISNGLINNRPVPDIPKKIDLIKKLDTTELDEVIKDSTDGNLLNSISKLSPKTISKYIADKQSELERIDSIFSKISKDGNLTGDKESNILVNKMNQGTNNNQSNIKLNTDVDQSNEEILNQSVILNKDLVSPINNVINPDIALDKRTLEIDWEAQSALIDKKTNIDSILVNQKTNKLLNDSILNLDQTPEKLERVSQIANKKTTETVDTTKYNGQVSELAINDSRLDIDRIIKTNPSGRHETDELSIFSNKINQELNVFDDRNANGFKNNQPLLKTEYKNNTSDYGYDTLIETNYFDITKQNTTDGFTSFADLYDTKYIVDSSIFNWNGNKSSVPTVNYFDVNKNYTISGFDSLVTLYNTKYIPQSSRFDWNGDRTKAPNVNYFDLIKQNTYRGFHTFASELEETSYNTKNNTLNQNASRFDWDGGRTKAPTVNYFDLTDTKKTTTGFHSFAQLYDTKYVPESSQFDWDGARNNAPITDYFDLTDTKKTTTGFHSFAQLYDTKYVPESSQFDWDGDRTKAPITDYFDLTDTKKTTAGFHSFAQLYDTKYVPESSQFDWDGDRNNAPNIDYFDLNTVKKTTAGFHSFAQLYDTKYIPESSQFDWDGTPQSSLENFVDMFPNTNANGFKKFTLPLVSEYKNETSRFDWDGIRSSAPSIDYFDLNTVKKTTAGFHTFAGLHDTKYVPESSQFDWDGDRTKAPITDYFDLNTVKKTTAGFHAFAGLHDTKYVPESSQFDWDGDRNNAPNIDYFDLTNPKKTTAGFHRFAGLHDTKYVPESSQFDWDGNSSLAPNVNYLDLSAVKKTTAGFHTFAGLHDTKYVPESSQFDWDGNRLSSPVVDYFDLTNPKKTTAGFHSFAQLTDSKYVTGSSNFEWKGNKSNVPSVNYFDLSSPEKTTVGFHSFAQKYDSKFVNDISTYQWKGIANDAPSVNYFDLNDRITFRGFHTFAQQREPTAYKNDLAFLLPNTTNFDWDGGNVYGQTPTKFFGYTQNEKFGFVIKMSQFDGTTFPIIKPEFKYDIAVGTSQIVNRDTLSGLRAQSEPLQTSDIEKYVPNALGNKFISGKKSTLENQIPVVNIQKLSFDITPYRRRGTSPSFKRYTEGGGVNERPTYVDGGMEVWANSDITIQQPPPQPGPIFGNQTAAQIIGLNRSAPVIVYNKDTAKTQIDKQYIKYDLVEESYNTDGKYPQPFIDTSINGRDRDITLGLKIDEDIKLKLNSSYDLKAFNLNIPDNVRSFIGSSFDYVKDAYNTFLPTLQSYRTFDEGLVRGGAVQHTIRTLLDAKRITKFLLSTKGILWNLKQFGLQFMNPMQDTDTGFLGIAGALGLPGGAFGFNWTSIYNPLSVPANILGKSILINSKFTRHGILMYGEGAYEDIAVNRNDNTDNRNFEDFTRPSLFNRTSDYNRLISLTKELLPNSYESIMLKREPQNQTFLESVGSLAVDFRDNLFSILGIGGRWNGLPTSDGRTTIRRLSTPFGGPNSFLGLFGTTINRATHPYKGVNSTGYFPTRESILSGKDREVFYGAREGEEIKYKDYRLAAYRSGQQGDESIHGQLWNTSVKRTRKENIYSDGVQRSLAERVGNKIFKFTYRSLSDRLNVNPNLSIGSEMDSVNPMDETEISNFKTTKYGELQRISKTKVSDFRKFILSGGDTTSQDPNASAAQSFVTNADVIDIANNDIEKRFGLGNPGAVKRRRDIPYMSRIKYSSLLLPSDTENESQLSNYQYAAYPVLKENGSGLPTEKITGADRINIIDWKRSTQDLNSDYVYERSNQSIQRMNDALGGTEDLIQFYFSGVNLKASEFKPTEAIVFRAYLDTIIDNHKPAWSPIKYIGRADPVYAYDGYERDINFGFTVHIGSRDELKASWRKLNMLASWTAPEYIDKYEDGRLQKEFGTPGTMKAPVIRLNIGNLYRKFPGFLSSLTYTFDNTQTTWETAKLKEDQLLTGPEGELSKPGALELPKTINVQCTFVPFNIYRPEWDCVFYSLFDDYTGEGNVETGLVPLSDDRVNYFKTHDDLPSSHKMNSGLCAILPKELPPQPVEVQVVEEKKPEPEPVVEKRTIKNGCKIYFALDEDRYPIGYTNNDPYSVKGISDIATYMLNDCPNVKIQIEGHASRESAKPSSLNKEYNRLLSESRAETVVRLLLDAGVPVDRLTYKGFGFEKLINEKNPKSPENRRIEITILNPEDASCKTELDINAKDQTGCPSPAEIKRKDIGDQSEFWVVGPQYFTEGPFDSIPAGEDPENYDKTITGNKYYKPVSGVTNWKQKWVGRNYKITSYQVRQKNNKGISTYYASPKDQN